jgi:WD40 repeat protein/tRNA A-37 threonylcarbamoyl transferase component Bud32
MSNAQDQRLHEVIAAYLEAMRAGQAPDRQKLIAGHPELAADLAAFFADHDNVRHLAEMPTPAPTEPATESPLGTVRYFGDYELLEKIAEGGMGVVYKARQLSLQRLVALKMVRAGEFATPADVQRFRTEAENAANLDHPNIVPIYEVGEHEGRHYFSMKLIEGGCLGPLVPRLRRDPRAAARLMAAAARAVQHAHQRGILHRDLKPGNILVDAGGQPHVTDFGLARRLEAETSLSPSGAILGTPAYMPPEQAAPRKGRLTTAADVYALGAVLYELLTGRPPFQADTPLDTLLQVLEKEPERPRAIHPGLDRDLETVCLKCLEKDPTKRYGSAEALADDLERWLGGGPVQARPSSSWERALKWVRRRPAAAALIAVSGAALLSIGVLVGVLWHQAEQQAALERQQKERLLEKTAEQERLNARLEEQRDRTLEQERRARRYLYAGRISLAQQALEIGNAERALALLGLQRPQEAEEDLRGFEWYHLWHLCHRDLLTLRGIQGVAVLSPDCKVVAAPVAAGVVQLWALPGGKKCGTLRGHRSPVQHLAFRPDGRTLATGSADGTVTLWDLAATREQGTLAGHQRGVTVVRFSPDGTALVAGNEAGAVTLWDVGKRAARASLAGHRGAVLSAVFVPGGKTLVTRDAEGVAKCWDGLSGREVATLKGYRGMISCEAISPDGKTLATGTVAVDFPLSLVSFDIRQHWYVPMPNTSGEVILWDLATGRKLATLGGHEGMVTSVAFAPDGKTLASTSLASTRMTLWEDPPQPRDLPGQLKLWDLATGKERASQPHPRGLQSLAFSPDGKTLAGSAGPFGEIDLWDARAGRLRSTLVGHTAAVTALGFLPDGKTVLTLADDNTLRLWDAEAPPEPLPLYDPGGIMTQGNVVFLPNGETLLMCRPGRPVSHWDTRTGQKLPPLGSSVWPPRVGPVVLAPDGKTLATGTVALAWVHDLTLWDATTLRERRTLKSAHTQGGDHQHALAFSPSGKLLATAGWGDGVRLWDTSTGNWTTTGDPSPGVQSVAFAPDGTAFATGGENGNLTLWDTTTWKERVSWSGHADAVCALAFSPNGKLLASGCGNPVVGRKPCEAKLWDAAGGKQLFSLQGHLGPVTAVAFSPDGKRLATASADRTVKLWDVVSGQCLVTLTGHGGAVDGLVFRADGRLLATTSRDGTVRLWHAASEDDVKAREP